MNRYFAIYHGLHERAAWGVAVERCEPHLPGVARVELLMLCRSEKEATTAANLTKVGHEMQMFRDQKVAERETQIAVGQ